MRLDRAQCLAQKLVDSFAPCCERVEVAGSVRRKKADVKDIEIVAVPKMTLRQCGLFPDDQERVSMLDEFLDGIVARSKVLTKDDQRPPCWGPRSKRLRFDGEAVDLFIVLPPAQWGLIHFLRTGPADWSRLAVTQRLKGGWLPNSMRVREGRIMQRGELVRTPTEGCVFEVLGMPFVAPEFRRV